MLFINNFSLNFLLCSLELQAKIYMLTDTVLTKVTNLAARRTAEFLRFDALDLLESIKNIAQDNKHDKAKY